MLSSLDLFEGMTWLVWNAGLWKAGDEVRTSPFRKGGFWKCAGLMV